MQIRRCDLTAGSVNNGNARFFSRSSRNGNPCAARPRSVRCASCWNSRLLLFSATACRSYGQQEDQQRPERTCLTSLVYRLGWGRHLCDFTGLKVQSLSMAGCLRRARDCTETSFPSAWPSPSHLSGCARRSACCASRQSRYISRRACLVARISPRRRHLEVSATRQSQSCRADLEAIAQDCRRARRSRTSGIPHGRTGRARPPMARTLSVSTKPARTTTHTTAAMEELLVENVRS